MDRFLTHPRSPRSPQPSSAAQDEDEDEDEDEDSTELKLAILASLHPDVTQEAILDVLLAHDGSMDDASASLKSSPPSSKRSFGALGHQQSLKHFAIPSTSTVSPVSPDVSPKKRKIISKKGATLHLYDPSDVAEHTPCTIIHNFLPVEDADQLLRELLDEAKTFNRITFKLFENVVSSPHTSSFYVETSDDVKTQQDSYFYNGGQLTDVRRITPMLAKVKPLVQETVNREIQHWIGTRCPGGRKLKHQSPQPWAPNVAFVNCYSGPQQNVGWHSDQLTYLGPRAVIGSISLGVAREFRVRRVLPRDADSRRPEDSDAEGQISIHLPHNSLLVMHAEMQEEWKHCIAPAASIDPHPIAGDKRINITYRHYRPEMHPSKTPRCDCKVPCVLRVVQRKRENFGKYFWMCYAGNIIGREGCSFFQWAEFDDDGNPRPSTKTSRPP